MCLFFSLQIFNFSHTDLEFENFTFDWNFTDIETLEDPWTKKYPVKIATDVIVTIGIVITGLATFLLIKILASFSERRKLPRIWTLLGIFVAHLLLLIFKKVEEHLLELIQTAQSDILCVFLICINPCLDCVSILGSLLLSYHVFTIIHIPGASRGRQALIFWITAEIVSWLLGFAIPLGIFAPYTSVVEVGISFAQKYVCVMEFHRLNFHFIIHSCVTFLLPYVFAVQPAVASLGIICVNKSRRPPASIELSGKPGECQFNPEYFAPDIADTPEETGSNKNPINHLDSDKKFIFPWVIFNITNNFLGFFCRLLYQLQNQEFFSEGAFDSIKEQISFSNISSLLYYIYVSFMPLLCLMLAEVRCGLLGKCKQRKR